MTLLAAPDVLVGQIAQAGCDDQEEHHRDAGPVTTLELGLGCPHQERGHVLGHLVHGRLGAIGIGHLAFAVERRRHGDVEVREIRIVRSEEHTSELQSLMRISYAVFCLKKKKNTYIPNSQLKYPTILHNNESQIHT